MSSKHSLTPEELRLREDRAQSEAPILSSRSISCEAAELERLRQNAVHTRTAPYHRVCFNEPFALEFGGVLPQLEIRYETWGVPNAEFDNVILVCPAFSASAHASSHPGNMEAGWWETLIGPELAFDTNDYFVLCPALLGGSRGTTGPNSIDPRTGEIYGSTFPRVSVRDIVRAHILLLDYLGIERLQAVVGGSLGAMEALELGISYHERTDRVFAVAGTDKTRPYTSAIRHLGRQAILKARKLGDEKEGLKLAREIATIFYRSRGEFNQRFKPEPNAPFEDGTGMFAQMESYLGHQAEKALKIFDIDAYLTLSWAMDLQDVWRGFGSPEDALAGNEARFMIVGFEEDGLISISEQEELHRTLVASDIQSSWRRCSSPVGHDAFLVETVMMTDLVNEFFTL